MAIRLMVQPDAGLEPILRIFHRARRSIDVALFRVDLRPFEKALGEAVERGVAVRALVAHTNRGGEERLRKLEQRLLASGVMVARTASDLLKYHGKYCLVDDVLHLFGFNLTKQNITRTRSFGIQTRHRRAVKDARLLFESDLARQPYVGSAGSPLVVSPESSREALRQFIAGARRSLAIYDPRLDDPMFVKLIQQRIASGVEVRIIGRAKRLQKSARVSALDGPKLHVRAMIRDGTRAFVGSQSLRRLELDSRREVGLLVTNPVVCRRMLEVFDADWAASAGDDDEPRADERNAGRESRPVSPSAA